MSTWRPYHWAWDFATMVVVFALLILALCTWGGCTLHVHVWGRYDLQDSDAAPHNDVIWEFNSDERTTEREEDDHRGDRGSNPVDGGPG